jgi:hypothetical protein
LPALPSGLVATWSIVNAISSGKILKVSSLLVPIAIVGFFWWKLSPSNNTKLSFAATATNLSYPENEIVAGTNWKKGYRDVRLVIKSTYDLSMLNLNVTIRTVEEASLLEGMEQTSGISGVEFHPPPPPIEFPDLQLIGEDRSRANIKPDFDEAIAKLVKSGHWYRITCQRLEPRNG